MRTRNELIDLGCFTAEQLQAEYDRLTTLAAHCQSHAAKVSQEIKRRKKKKKKKKRQLFRKQVTLDDATIQQLEVLGRGNLSAGIREAARRVRVKKGN